ncbi:MAG: integral rane sensor signal transduction histidine kinase [Alphaproteobacteria bacterium]|nr:integral rane sensor signal transduction histidine kinase [Alphaproteobacteria bacterium]MDB5739089.1 integral rane sensor signal transduction histidine kinase [Alphaproteobacteria bacterium]
MRTGQLLRTQAFRIVLVYVLLFALSVAALLAFTYWNTRRTLDAQTDQIIEAEITGLAEQYTHLGVRGLVEAVRARSLHGGQALYLVSDTQHHYITGNLNAWPQLSEAQGSQFVEFDYERPVDGKLETRRARGRMFALSGDFILLVAQDVHERYLTTRMFTTTLPWTVGLILLLGLAGGALMSRNMLRRLDAINRTSGEIIKGDLTRRVPLAGSGDEFDLLAENLNRMLDRIERLMKGLREVTDSVAHDLRTPLNRLRNRLEESVARLHASGAQASEIERAIAETDQLIGTFNALLLIAETDAGTTRAAMTALDLGEVAADVVELYEPLAEERRVKLVLLPPGPVTVEGNRSLIAQALANLVDNAIKYTPEGGAVRIRIAAADTGVDLSVADSGPGIPAEDRTRVVERFVRLEASRNSPGTGLGLSLVAAVAHFHNAELVLQDSDVPGAPSGLMAVLRFPKPVSRVATLKNAAE